MTGRICMTLVLSIALIRPEVISAQSRGSQVPKTSQQPPAGKRGISPKPQPPLTLRQVIESLLSSKSSSRAENLVAMRGIQFESTPATLDILKELGASDKLLSMISANSKPSTQPAASEVAAPANKVAGPLNIVCEPTDCLVVVDSYRGLTVQNRMTVTGLKPGEFAVQVLAEGYEPVGQKIRLEEGKPLEATFRLKRTEWSRQQAASVSVLKVLRALGGADGIAELGDIEGDGMLDWADSAGKRQQWPMTFKKQIGDDLRMTFKTKNGQCTGSMSGQSAKQDCKGDLKGGENITAQATSLFLSYQLQDVMQTLMNRPLLTSETSDDRLESAGNRDAYSLTLGPAGLPVDLIYKSDQEGTDLPIQVQYANYLKLNKGRYPGRVAIGRINATPVFIFTITNVRTVTKD
jgi:PEGA domain-containing protein